MNTTSLSNRLTLATLAWCISTPAQAAIQINGDLANGALGVGNVVILPDSSRAIYTAQLDTAGVTKLYSASTNASGTQVQLNSEPVAGGNVGSFDVTPDSTAVVYIGDLLSDNDFELFSASSTLSGAEVRLNDVADTNEDAGPFKLVPNSNLVLYRADLDTDNNFELYSAQIGMAGTQIRLTNEPVTNGDVGLGSDAFAATPDGTRAIYVGDLITDTVNEMFSAPVNTAGMQTKISSVPVDTTFNLPFVGDFLLTSNSARAIYRSNTDRQLYSASTISAGMELKLSDSPAGNLVTNMQLAPNDSRVTYTGQLLATGVNELFSADPTLAGSQVKLNDTPVAGGGVGGWLISPDSTRVVFNGDLLVDEQRDLFSALIGVAGSQLQLNTNATAGGDTSIVGFTPSGSHVIYSGDMNTLGQRELYSASTTASGTQITLTTNTLGASGGGGFGRTLLTPEGSRVVYSTIYTTAGVFDIYSASVSAAGTQVNLTNLSAGQNLGTLLISPDSKFVVYNVDTDNNATLDALFAADLLGQNPPVQLNDPLVAGGQINFFDFFITPDSQTVIYKADQDVVGEKKLFAATLPNLSTSGDFDLDGDVDGRDFLVWQRGGSPKGINSGDLALWQAQYGTPLASSRAVTEPGAGLFLLFAYPLLFRRRRILLHLGEYLVS